MIKLKGPIKLKIMIRLKGPIILEILLITRQKLLVVTFTVSD